MPNQPAPIETFYSYAHEDELLRNELENHLSILHHRGLISSWHDRRIDAGTNWAQAIDTHLETASLILLLISSDFLASNYCYSIEMQRALERHHANEAQVLPILLRPVSWEGAPFEHLAVLPTDGQPVTEWSNQDAAFRDIATGIRRVLESLPQLLVSPPSSMWPRIWNIPSARNPVFTGREALLSRLHTQLLSGQATALSQAQAISGLGGIGKTQIVIEYAYRYRHDYQAVFWVLADTRESLVSGSISIAQLLKLAERDAQDQQIIIQAVKTWLQTHNSWLLILDNADDLTLVREFVPQVFAGHILLTTRAQAVGRLARRIEVDIMSPDIGALFLLRRASLLEPDAPLSDAEPNDVTTAREITRQLDGLPLALDQAGAYIEEIPCRLQDYLNLYQQHGLEMLKARGQLVDDHPQPVAITWLLSFEKVEQQDPAAAELLRMCALLAPDDIPEEIISQGADHLGPILSPLSSAPLLLNRAIALLGTYSLIRRNTKEQTLSIHRLVQAVIRDLMDEQTRHLWAERAVQVVNQVFPEVEFKTWPQCERYLPHALVCAEFMEKEQISSPEAARLLNQAGLYLHDRARYAEAEPLHKRALAIKEQQLGADHPSTATSLNNLAELYWDQGKYAEAEPLHKRALAIREEQLGADHPSTATSLNNLAELYRVQDKYTEAEPLYKRALAIYEQQLEPNHPSTATSLNNLAALYKIQSKYAEAEPLYKRALAIKEQQLGPEHPSTAQSLHNLAALYYAQKKYKEAEPLFKQALLIREQTLGFSHPLTQSTRGWYISVLRKLRREEEASALEAQGRISSEEH